MENKYYILENVREGEIAGYISSYSFSHNVFHSYISLVLQNAVLCHIGLKLGDSVTFKGKNFADHIINAAQKLEPRIWKKENIIGTGEYAGDQLQMKQSDRLSCDHQG